MLNSYICVTPTPPPPPKKKENKNRHFINLHYKVTQKVLTTDFHLLELITVKSNLSEIYIV